ncbi:unnamed protein product [Caenorhabditis auriculariae]|uniref:G-protein coupled receptors family 1 profile domain-containing protein n=1 Tax=Caenorhabditis auriculariae TaxID=2777116 RepID=A0A8S1H3K2_9PELO|nr:unnamed protein product [Caenorhabditis auriculariae]
MASTAVFLCGSLGGMSVVLNLFVISALLRHRHRVLSNVFYVIVLHCAILDVARGVCLIVYGLPHFANTIYKLNLSITTRIALFRGSTFALVVLRICNLLTIFNLLVFTTNEFIVIRYPLHYRRYFRRRAVLVILTCCWIVSIVMGCGLLIPSSASNPTMRREHDGDWQIDLATLSLLMISVCYAFILRTIRRFKDESGTLNNEESHRIHNRSLHRQVNNQNSNCSSGSRWRGVQAMSRHKYIYVIGSVLIVDLLFLCPYSGIQLVAFLHINNLIEITHGSTLIRWWLQVLIGVHSVCQPLCYFRMTEFRRLACCNPRRPWNRTKSFSQMNKSFGSANTRSAVREEENGVEPFDPNCPLLKDGEVTPARSERSPTHAWTRGESIRFRTYGNDFAQHATPVKKDSTISEVMEMRVIPNGIDVVAPANGTIEANHI